jgi:hypothetical protein
MCSSGRVHVEKFLSSLSENKQVYIEGQVSDSPQEVVDVIKKIRYSPGHRSHPETEIKVQIIDGGEKMNLLLGRDSDVSYEYWVYYLMALS